MNHKVLLTTLCALCTIGLTQTHAMTADELARYLDVTAISTTVELPAESFVTEVWTIKDGQADKRLIEGMAAWNREPDRGITVMIGAENGTYKVVVAYGGGVTMRALSGIPVFRGTLSGDFPQKISEGDYPLFGEPRFGAGGSAREMNTFKRGFLLRIRKLP